MIFLSFWYFLIFQITQENFSYRTLTYLQRLTGGAKAQSAATQALTKSRMMSARLELPGQARIRGFDANWDARLGVLDAGEQGESNGASAAI
jgi:hypothetical protein